MANGLVSATPEVDALFEIVQQGRALGEELFVAKLYREATSKNPIALQDPTLVGTQELLIQDRQARLDEMSAEAGERFIGKSVCITPLNVPPNPKPITALCYVTPYARFGTARYEAHSGIFLRRHPRQAVGKIGVFDLSIGVLGVVPRWFSPYRADRGYFSVELLGDEEPLVSVEFVQE